MIRLTLNTWSKKSLSSNNIKYYEHKMHVYLFHSTSYYETEIKIKNAFITLKAKQWNLRLLYISFGTKQYYNIACKEGQA